MPDSGPSLRILVVDDERDSVLTLVSLLGEEGHEARGVYDGREALAAAREFDPDVVLLDIAMPGISGWDTAREIRKAGGTARPMLIAISGQYNRSSDKILAQMAGFDFHLAKPYDPNVLLALIAPLRSAQ